jgi:acetyl-CoA acetyltransferase
MGQTAEVLAREFRIGRAAQDAFALRSHQLAVAARERLREEIVPVFPPPGFEAVRDDIGPREGQTLEALGKLKPYFDRRNGTVTVGNACQVTDGAVALLVGDDATARRWPTPPLGRSARSRSPGCAPRMGLGPVFAMARRAREAGLGSTTSSCSRSTRRSPPRCSRASRPRVRVVRAAELGRDRALGEIPLERST